jgi:hypothetical protein
MKSIVMIGVVFCMVAFTQCNKEQPIDELITQETEEYDNLDKVETIWEEGCGKISPEEILKEFNEVFDNTPAIKRQYVDPYTENMRATWVVRLGTNCGDNPMAHIFMDCEDSNPNTGIYPPSLTWYSNGVSVDGNKNAHLWLCGVTLANNFQSLPTKKEGKSIGYLIMGIGPYFQRYFDNEDKNNKNYVDFYRAGNPYTPIRVNFSNTSAFETQMLRPLMNQSSYGTLLEFYSKDPSANDANDVSKYPFPYLGFPYAVFWNGTGAIRLHIDDEDNKNANTWTTSGMNSSAGAYQDHGFISGGADTDIYIVKVQ